MILELLRYWKRLLIFGLIGIAGGYAYYHFIGCTSGTCPITSNPYLSTFYGGLIGITLGWPKRTFQDKEDTVERKDDRTGT